MIIIDKETTDFVKLINLMLPEHGDIALIDDDVNLKGETRFMAGDDDTYRLIYDPKKTYEMGAVLPLNDTLGVTKYKVVATLINNGGKYTLFIKDGVGGVA